MQRSVPPAVSAVQRADTRCQRVLWTGVAHSAQVRRGTARTSQLIRTATADIASARSSAGPGPHYSEYGTLTVRLKSGASGVRPMPSTPTKVALGDIAWVTPRLIVAALASLPISFAHSVPS